MVAGWVGGLRAMRGGWWADCPPYGSLGYFAEGYAVPKKPTWPIGETRLSFSPDGRVDIINPTDNHAGSKEEVEAFFAKIFCVEHNRTLPRGPGTEIAILTQNDTSDLDFNIESALGSFLELAEMTPVSEPFAQPAIETGHIDVYEMSKWAWQKVIEKKSARYAAKAGETVLLLYSARREFYLAQPFIECLQSTLVRKGCMFSTVFVMNTNGTDFATLDLAHPYSGPTLPHPRFFKKHGSYQNITFENARIEGDRVVVRIPNPFKGG